MPKHWEEDQMYLLNSIEDYRNQIVGKDLKEARRITMEFSGKLHKQTPELHHRTVNSITECISQVKSEPFRNLILSHFFCSLFHPFFRLSHSIGRTNHIYDM